MYKKNFIKSLGHAKSLLKWFLSLKKKLIQHFYMVALINPFCDQVIYTWEILNYSCVGREHRKETKPKRKIPKWSNYFRNYKTIQQQQIW